MRIGYHASHEQFPPEDLLRFARLAESSGFQAISCSDHFRPWSMRQGHSGFAWSWLGAAMEATRLPYLTVSAPGQRYHPAIIAQAAATLARLYPGRFSLVLGSGERLNESVTGDRWPSEAERDERLRACAEVIHDLLAGKTVSRRDSVRTEAARLYTLPDNPPPLLTAAITPETAAWAGPWSDGLLTIAQTAEATTKAFRRSGGQGKPVFVKLTISYARTEDAARTGAWEQWRTNLFRSAVLSELALPEHYDAAADHVHPAEVADAMLVSADPRSFLAALRGLRKSGADAVYIHNVNRGQEEFIRDFGEQVIPEFATLAGR